MISSDEYLKRYMLTCNKWTTNLVATFIFSIQTRAWYRTTMLAYKMVPEPIVINGGTWGSYKRAFK